MNTIKPLVRLSVVLTNTLIPSIFNCSNKVVLRTPAFLFTAGIKMTGPKPIVIAGPSGSGKSTLLKKLLEEFPNTFGFSVSHTTRQPREGEQHGIHYHYVTKEYMENAIKRGEFIETAVFSGNTYGTSEAAVLKVQNEGKVCILDIEIEGVKQIKQSHLKPLYIFIWPPSLDELEKRLRGRNTETEKSLKMRLDTAKNELEYAAAGNNFDFIVHNHDIDTAYADLREYIVNQLLEQRAHGVTLNLPDDVVARKAKV